MSTINANQIKNFSLSKSFSFLLKLFFTILILYFVLSSVPLSEYKRALNLLSINSLAFILLLVLMQVLLLAIRWYLVAKTVNSNLTIRTAFYGILISFFFSQGLPASIGGDAFRIWWHRKEGLPTSSGLKIIFFDRVYGLLSLIALCILSLCLLINLLGYDTRIISLAFLILIGGIGLLLLIMPWRLGLSDWIQRCSQYLPASIKKMTFWLLTSRTTLSELSLPITLSLLVLGMLTHSLVVLQVLIAGSILDPGQLNLIDCLAAVPPALLVSYMPFSIAGWGVREASMVVSFALLGIKASTAILMSLVIGMAVLMISILGGAIWILGGFKKAYTENRKLILEVET